MSQATAYSVARVYTDALFELALADHQTVAVRGELDALGKLLDGDDGFACLLENPAIRRDEKTELLTRLFENRFSRLMMNTLGVLATKDRLSLLRDIRTEYSTLEDRHAGRVDGTLVTAIELGKDEITRLAEQIGRMLKKKIKLEGTVDPAILGGLILKVEGKVWDDSVRKSLGEMTKEIKNARNRKLTA